VEPDGGYAKQLSLGHVAYFGLGAHTSTILEIHFGISPRIGMLAGGIVAMLASLPIGWLCFRLHGPYFAIATIATAQVLMLLVLNAILLGAPRARPLTTSATHR
jgi:branched-chain amino acid transport system permease protein